uniref:Uncharacterized protein n=1 Tax=Chromera velia CCMP2878 TaxID=1169474 RepID=A0A0G4GGC2_9ALVE|eukprot:Cvel_4650.t1-p1 / transcript=Cvel_4650.t1 / gene=Cvel_4650 / organism=Chromera_velia_CCMP2878 / gene_product=26S proteasome non-ATPase regulatory subunit 10, putative / transcript_product=26S proteasome non-ATPase regulatory subunit 10, putative / location=Cvel_scaffold205:66976-67944(-) / protein_length=323 / sequence_SO=supercontig / SO=protein_coding / is_pseudo=false
MGLCVSSPETQLHKGIQRSKPELVEKALARNPDLEANPWKWKKGKGKTTFLQIACCKLPTEAGLQIVQMLVEKGANVLATTEPERTSVLMGAMRRGYLQMCTYLLSLPEIDELICMADCNNDLPLHVQTFPLSSGPCLMSDVFPPLVAKYREFFPEGIDAINHRGETPLMLAAFYGNTTLVKMLMDAGAAAQKSDEYGRTALMRACEWVQIETVKLLVDTYNCSVNAVDREGQGCLHYATSPYVDAVKRSEVREFLISRGADDSLKDHKGRTNLEVIKERAQKKKEDDAKWDYEMAKMKMEQDRIAADAMQREQDAAAFVPVG